MQTTVTSPESNTRLPRAVRERSERIRAMQEAQATSADAAPTLGPDGLPIEAAPVQAEAQPTAPQSPTAPLESLQADPRELTAEYWKQRFQVTQGLLNQQRNTVNELRADMNRQIAELQEQLRAQPAQPAVVADDDIDLTQYYTQDKIDEYGEDQLKTIVRTSLQAARKEAQAAVEQAVAPIRQSEKERTQQTLEQEKQRFHDQIASHVPDWVEVDASPEWAAWLQEVDEMTGLERNQILMTNYQRRNLNIVVKMFREFKAGSQPVLPVPPLVPQGAGRAGTAPQGDVQARPAGGMPSPAEIREFYKRSSLGKVSKEERAAFEARLKAVANG